MSDHAAPGFMRTAAKAVVAGAAALTVAGGTILAAVADDHVTTTEWVTIVLALAGAVAGPVGVYATTNARTPEQDRADAEHFLQMRLALALEDQPKSALDRHLYDSPPRGVPVVDAPPPPDRDTRPWTRPEG